MQGRTVTVVGGSGFIGRHLVRRLAAAGAIVRVAVRDTEAAMFLKPMGDVGQIVLMKASVSDDASLRAAVAGADAVVNLVGILYEGGKRTFQAIHVEGAANVARAAKAAGVARLVHVSALGADSSSASAYARSKAEGEVALRAAFPEATILRPSVVFGPEDDFFNRFGKLAEMLPVMPVIGHCPPCPVGRCAEKPAPRLQPVYVGDVAEALVRVLDNPATAGKTFELGGPRTYTLRQVIELVLHETRRKPILVPLPFALAKFQAALLALLPKPPLTPDQVELLKVDNVTGGTLPGFAELGIVPVAAEGIVVEYLERYRPPHDSRTRPVG